MKRTAIIAAGALAFSLGLSACSQDEEGNLESPTFITLDNLHGAEVEISQNRPLVVPVGPNEDPAKWTEGSVEDTTIAEFTPGKKDGSATFNPGFRAVGEGVTGAELVNPNTGEAITFTLTVK